ncbi:sensor N-terminal transmembrane domain-containing protein, partial [Hyphomonas sp.]|uniref:sensor N-terminal transmembrane domain-containing protein n=1 Tax=Hyphomonas sp. TaxID=87 RepID=UPI0032429F8F
MWSTSWPRASRRAIRTRSSPCASPPTPDLAPAGRIRMAGKDKTRKTPRAGLNSSVVFGSRIARLIFASNLAGLAILIIGAMVLNEMRAGFVVS